MAVFKCKMCGGQLEVQENQTVIECEYCETKQTVSKTKDSVIANLFNRANNLRIKCDFDKALSIYEKIIEQDDSDSEAHWGMVLCKYGIEYVEDPVTFKRVPTCHRTLFESILKDVDYEAAIDYADVLQQELYEKEARTIDKIQKNILSIVNNEKPFDVFICYKETDENGKRTIDSTIANDIYYQLTQEGFKVFYAAITLEDKLGQEYEPYIFAALNSSKVMLALGTKPEYFNAVWVKNEWSRYMKLMKTDRSKLLIPCYRDMDAYDLPEEFAHLQSQDMSKIGFINDIVRGIKKVVQIEQPKSNTVETNHNSNPTVDSLLKRVFIFLEEKNWDCANEYCEKVLDIDPENARAYLGKLMADLKVSVCNNLANCQSSFHENRNYQMALRFADKNLKDELKDYIKSIYISEKDIAYNNAVIKMNNAQCERAYREVASEFEKLKGHKDSATLYVECINKADEAKNARINKKAKINQLVEEYKSLYCKDKQNSKLSEIESELNKYKNGNLFCKSMNYISANVGDIITFGNYNQSGNGNEPLQWKVIDKKDNQILIISKYILDMYLYNQESIARSKWGKIRYNWSNADIRRWLNSEFLKDAFSVDEQKLICTSTIEYKEYENSLKNPTYDSKLFLLSIDEITKYFDSEELRKCECTKFAKAKGLKTGLFNNFAAWWLRDTNNSDNMHTFGACVANNGKFLNIQVNYYVGVRPCLWLGVDTSKIE